MIDMIVVNMIDITSRWWIVVNIIDIIDIDGGLGGIFFGNAISPSARSLGVVRSREGDFPKL